MMRPPHRGWIEPNLNRENPLCVGSGSSATVTKVTVPSFFVDLEANFFLATCDVTLVVNRNHRKELFQCSFDDAVPTTCAAGPCTGDARGSLPLG
jgi:hypothetical protein